MPADPVVVALLVTGAASWLVAICVALRLASKRRAGLSLLRLWLDGASWYRRDTFRPEAAPLHRVFVGASIVSGLCLVGVALRTIASS